MMPEGLGGIAGAAMGATPMGMGMQALGGLAGAAGSSASSEASGGQSEGGDISNSGNLNNSGSGLSFGGKGGVSSGVNPLYIVGGVVAVGLIGYLILKK